MPTAARLLLPAALTFLAAQARPGEAAGPPPGDVRILGLKPVDFTAAGGGSPHVGDPFYGLWIHYEVLRPHPGPIEVRMRMGGQTSVWENAPGSVGRHSGWRGFDSGLDGDIPYSAEIVAPDPRWGQPAGKSGASGTFQPIPPETGIELYDPKRIKARQSRFMDFKPASGVVGLIRYLFGVPGETGTQRDVKDHVPPEDSERLYAAEADVTAYLVKRPRFDTARERSFEREQSFKATLHACRVNSRLLDKVSWDELNAAPPAAVGFWRISEKIAPSYHPLTQGFIRRHLGEDFRRSMTPYEAARRLYLGLLKDYTYGDTSAHATVQESFADGGKGACGTFSYFYVAALRNIGFAARVSAGWWQGEGRDPDITLVHMWAEFYMPGYGWVPADPSIGLRLDATGRYPYYFGNVPYLNMLVSVTNGGHLDWPGFGVADFLQVPHWLWNGGAELERSGCFLSNRIAEPLQVQLPLPRADTRRPSYGNIETDTPAPRGGLKVALSSSDPRATVPAEVLIPEGQKRALFVIGFPAPFSGSVSFTANANGQTARAGLRCDK